MGNKQKYMVDVVNTNSDTDTGCSTAIFKLPDTTHDKIGEQAVSGMNAQPDDETMQTDDYFFCEADTGAIETKNGGLDSKI